MDGNGASSGGAAHSYIGSLISLTSKSEIRYEGILYTLDTANSNIALQDVRSFGTEGRKKDGPQIPSSDKVYDYIIFRGTDIKDLQVKSSPPVRPAQTQPPHHDPAIISLQSQTSSLAPPSVSTGNVSASVVSSAAASSTGSIVDGINPGPYSSIPSANYQASMPPLYQPYGGLGSWAMPQISPATNGTMGMPMYWPGYYRPPGGISPLQQQSPLPFQAPLSMPGYLAQSRPLPQMPLPAPLSKPMSPSLPDTSQQPTSEKDLMVVSLSPDQTALSGTVPTFSSSSSFHVPGSLEHASSPSLENKVPSTTITTKFSAQVMAPAISNAQSTGSFIGHSSTNMSGTASAPDPADPMKGFDAFKEPVISDQPLAEHSATKEPIISTVTSSQLQSSANQPLLPLPVNPVRSKQYNQGYNLPSNTTFMRRGRGRGRNPESHSQFTEDFDFTAMNEKFNKDEVWGELGKSDFREKETEEDISEYAHYEEEEFPRAAPVYVKDDFFDTLSCDAFDRGGQAERTKFSEQRKIDTETFGRFSVRSRGGRGGRGGYGGGSRGGFYGGRLVGNGGRGRGYARNSAAY